LDVSGSKARRPVLDAIIARVQSGDLGGIVVAKLDRTARPKE
jgi:DNA invertase Pin-like site-specific DNA recombinase